MEHGLDVVAIRVQHKGGGASLDKMPAGKTWKVYAESIPATGQPIPDQDFTRLWPGLSVSIQETPGEDQWQGLTLVKVAASDKSRRRKVEIQLARYIRRENAPDEGK